MRAVIQRVLRAEVTINGTERREIPEGFAVLLGVKNGDSERDAELLAKKTAELRIPVSYTHLDVYKRQAGFRWQPETRERQK